MPLGTSRKSGRLRNRLIVTVLIAAVGGTAWRVVSARRPQLPEPAAEPPRLGYATNGSTPQHATQR